MSHTSSRLSLTDLESFARSSGTIHHDRTASTVPGSFSSATVGTVTCPTQRPATPADVWIALTPPQTLALDDLLLIDSPGQQLLGIVAELQRVEDGTVHRTHAGRQQASTHTTWARLAILSSSDGRRRPPEGTTVRRPSPAEVTTLLAEARRIPPERRVPLGVISLPDGFAPVYGHLDRLVGPTATSTLISGAAGSLKSTAGALLITGLQQATRGQVALVLVNSKGNDFLFADYGRQTWAQKLDLPPLRPRDQAIYAAMGYAEPPVFARFTALVPETDDPAWRSIRPRDFPRTQPYHLSYESAIRHACSPTDEQEHPSSIITRQCIEEAAGPFARARKLRTLAELIDALEAEFLDLTSDRARWRNQFQATTVAAALRQLRATLRDLGPLVGAVGDAAAFPITELARGGTWVVDVAPLPQRAAQAVLDDLITALWQAKAAGVIPHHLPLVLLVDELNRWTATGPTAVRLAAIARDQRHRRFSLVGLAQQLSTLHPQLLANVDTFSIGNTRSQELAEDVYDHLPLHLRSQLHRLPEGQRVIDAWPFAQPLIVEVPFPSWLIADEGLLVVEAWTARRNPAAG